MLDSPMIDVALGLMSFFLVMALSVTAIQGWISNFLKLRGKNLEKGIKRLTNDDITDEIYKHPLMKTMGDKPSYLKSEYFSKILIEVIDPKKEALSKERDNITELIDKIENKDLKKIFKTFNIKADDKIDQLENQISNWFDTGMERASGWYQRQMQICSIVISTILVIFMNANALNIAKTLFYDDALRVKVSTIANQISKQDPKTDEEQNKLLKDLETQLKATDFPPIGWNKNPLKKVAEKDSDTFNWKETIIERAKSFFQNYWLIILIGIIGWLVLHVYIGWNKNSLKKKTEEKSNDISNWKETIIERAKSFFQNYWLIILIGIIGWLVLYILCASWYDIIGWFITISAVSLGAPFWFDLIGKVSSIRNSIKPEQKKEKENSNTKP